MNKSDPIREQYESRQEAFDSEVSRQVGVLIPEIEDYLRER